jgi:spermidine synthase
LIHGYVDLDDPAKPIYSYERLYDEMVRAAFPSRRDLDSFTIGGGTYTFPRYMEAHSDGAVIVAEIDPVVTEVAKEHLGLRPGPRMSIHHNDARRVLADLQTEKTFEIIAGDAFNDAAVPFHLTTDEFNQTIARHLAPDGLYLVNVVDAANYDFLRSYVRTLERTFGAVGVMVTDEQWPPNGGRGTYVVVAGDREIPQTPSLIDRASLEAFLEGHPWVSLTDDHVPVDQLLAPVFRQRLER